jgi:hypothetical protein
MAKEDPDSESCGEYLGVTLYKRRVDSGTKTAQVFYCTVTSKTGNRTFAADTIGSLRAKVDIAVNWS